VILKASEKHVLSINSEPVTIKTLRLRLHDIYATRAEKVLFVEADPALSFQDVAAIIDVTDGAVEHLEIVLISPEAAKEPCWFENYPRQIPPLPEQ